MHFSDVLQNCVFEDLCYNHTKKTRIGSRGHTNPSVGMTQTTYQKYYHFICCYVGNFIVTLLSFQKKDCWANCLFGIMTMMKTFNDMFLWHVTHFHHSQALTQ